MCKPMLADQIILASRFWSMANESIKNMVMLNNISQDCSGTHSRAL